MNVASQFSSALVWSVGLQSKNRRSLIMLTQQSAAEVETIPYGRGTFDRIACVVDPETRQQHLQLAGWLLVKDQPVDCFEVRLNGHAFRCEVTPRPDVAKHHAWIK